MDRLWSQPMCESGRRKKCESTWAHFHSDVDSSLNCDWSWDSIFTVRRLNTFASQKRKLFINRNVGTLHVHIFSCGLHFDIILLWLSLFHCQGWRSCSDRDSIRGKQISDLDSAEAGQTRHGSVQSGTAHLHPWAQVLPGQTVGLLLSCRFPVRVRMCP